MTAAWTLDLPDAEATRRLGQALGRALRPGLVVALEGDLGAGKTALTKAAIAALGQVEEDDVVSPTFVIAAEYPGTREVLHVDAYRLAGPGAFVDLGFGPLEACARAVIIEWADRVAAALPGDRLTVRLAHADPGRRATLEASGPSSTAALEAVRAAL
ncbi:MAG: tRNA (adenosine(37)-N6)-threonylcarbamoyltransferase complex ATPase subunit type 1 TsaE [Planctomycetes bacterium]|nr:tRNA (adenosine(37)-N6)-threonylcarbamoyltransferase complex ATPase subunit type 1 TsaE [Planctomycetota bacterium]